MIERQGYFNDHNGGYDHSIEMGGVKQIWNFGYSSFSRFRLVLQFYCNARYFFYMYVNLTDFK